MAKPSKAFQQPAEKHETNASHRRPPGGRSLIAHRLLLHPALFRQRAPPGEFVPQTSVAPNFELADRRDLHGCHWRRGQFHFQIKIPERQLSGCENCRKFAGASSSKLPFPSVFAKGLSSLMDDWIRLQ